MYERRGGSVFGAFLLGGLIGAVLGLLFAPRSGSETREILTDRANDYWGQAGEMYATGVDKVGEVVDSSKVTATEKSEQLREKIDEARARLQEQVAKSAEVAKDKLTDAAPAVKDAVDKAAEGTKSGVDFAHGKASGDGPVDAAYKAIEQASGVSVKVRKFEVHAVTVGEDAQGETVVYVDYNDRSYRGSSLSTNIVEASCKALLEVINRIEQSQGGARAQAREAALTAKSAL